MIAKDWQHIKETDECGDDVYCRRSYVTEPETVTRGNYRAILSQSPSFNLGRAVDEVLSVGTAGGRIDDAAILYREKNLKTGEFEYITFGDVKEALLKLKQEKGMLTDCRMKLTFPNTKCPVL